MRKTFTSLPPYFFCLPCSFQRNDTFRSLCISSIPSFSFVPRIFSKKKNFFLIRLLIPFILFFPLSFRCCCFFSRIVHTLVRRLGKEMVPPFFLKPSPRVLREKIIIIFFTSSSFSCGKRKKKRSTVIWSVFFCTPPAGLLLNGRTYFILGGGKGVCIFCLSAIPTVHHDVTHPFVWWPYQGP